MVIFHCFGAQAPWTPHTHHPAICIPCTRCVLPPACALPPHTPPPSGPRLPPSRALASRHAPRSSLIAPPSMRAASHPYARRPPSLFALEHAPTRALSRVPHALPYHPRPPSVPPLPSSCDLTPLDFPPLYFVPACFPQLSWPLSSPTPRSARNLCFLREVGGPSARRSLKRLERAARSSRSCLLPPPPLLLHPPFPRSLLS